MTIAVIKNRCRNILIKYFSFFFRFYTDYNLKKKRTEVFPTVQDPYVQYTCQHGLKYYSIVISTNVSRFTKKI